MRDRRLALEAPVITLRHRDRGTQATLILTAHFAEPRYFRELSEMPLPKTVFYEQVQTVDPSDEHWSEKHHRLLRKIRQGFYARLMEMGTLAFQEKAFPVQPGWINADVSCCELAAKLAHENVSTRQLELALTAVELLMRPGPGREVSNALMDRVIRGGLLFAGAGTGLELAGNKKLVHILNTWRSRRALETVLAAQVSEFALIYGAAHGDELLAGFRRAGYEELQRDWRVVLGW